MFVYVDGTLCQSCRVLQCRVSILVQENGAGLFSEVICQRERGQVTGPGKSCSLTQGVIRKRLFQFQIDGLFAGGASRRTDRQKRKRPLIQGLVRLCESVVAHAQVIAPGKIQVGLMVPANVSRIDGFPWSVHE